MSLNTQIEEVKKYSNEWAALYPKSRDKLIKSIQQDGVMRAVREKLQNQAIIDQQIKVVCDSIIELITTIETRISAPSLKQTQETSIKEALSKKKFQLENELDNSIQYPTDRIEDSARLYALKVGLVILKDSGF